MTLLINNDITRRVLKMNEAIDVMEHAMLQLARGDAAFQPRTDFWAPTAKTGGYYRWGSLLGAIKDPPTLALRFKSDIIVLDDYLGASTEEWYCMEPGRYCGFIILIDMTTGELIGLLNDGHIQHARVGATGGGLGAKYLARKDAEVAAIIGSGGMARTHAEAICAVRPIKEVRVFSPTPRNRGAFAEEMTERLGVRVVAVDNVAKAVRDADIVATCTDSRKHVYTADFVDLQKPGSFIVNVRPEEMDDATYKKVDKVIVTGKAGLSDYAIGNETELKNRPLQDPAYRRRYVAFDYPTLPQVMNGTAEGRTNDKETIFYHNVSAGIQFAAVGRLVYERAKAQGLGFPIPTDWFLQTIRN